jgi:hypothetical protein
MSFTAFLHERPSRTIHETQLAVSRITRNPVIPGETCFTAELHASTPPAASRHTPFYVGVAGRWR